MVTFSGNQFLARSRTNRKVREFVEIFTTKTLYFFVLQTLIVAMKKMSWMNQVITPSIKFFRTSWFCHFAPILFIIILVIHLFFEWTIWKSWKLWEESLKWLTNPNIPKYSRHYSLILHFYDLTDLEIPFSIKTCWVWWKWREIESRKETEYPAVIHSTRELMSLWATLSSMLSENCVDAIVL